MEYLTVMLGRLSPLGVEVDAVVVRVYAEHNRKSVCIHTYRIYRTNLMIHAAESKRRRLTAPLPASTKQRAFQFQRIHAPCHRARRNAEMRHLLPITVR